MMAAMQPTRPQLAGSFGMAASTHWLATGTAMSVLERGGNAFDAAVAAGFVLQVVEPHMCGPGGEVPAVVWSELDQQVHVVCGQGVAPAAATIAAFDDLGIAEIPGAGLLPATVPGAFGGWLLMLERWGTWSLRDVLDYAIGLARSGHPAAAGTAMTVGVVADMFQADWPTSYATWVPGGVLPRPGDTLINPILAGAYERIVRDAESAGSGRDSVIEAARRIWYQGFVAEAIGDFAAKPHRDPTGDSHAGLLTAQDLAQWQPTVEEPATLDYHRYTVCKTGAWGQGPVFLEQLGMLSGFDLAAMGHLSADCLHTVVEVAKLAFADREAWYGDDPAFGAVQRQLLDPAYLAGRSELVGPAASLELRPGSPADESPRLPHRLATADRGRGAGEPTIQASGTTRGDTCHLDVVDVWGNLVSATPSGGWLQSSPTIPELGFCLGTRAQMFWLEPGLASSLGPGRRPRTTLSPALALRDGEPWLAFGTPGGDQQDQWTLAFFLALVHGGLDLQSAIEAPSYHCDHFPSSFAPRVSRPGVVAVESRHDPGVLGELRARGHQIEDWGGWNLGRVSAVAREGSRRLAAADPRGSQGYAAGR
jgi:gamma-glutamyltranspeptidase/glutathione hydrolase